MSRKDKLQASREKIDAIDDEVIALISRRAELAKQARGNNDEKIVAIAS